MLMIPYLAKGLCIMCVLKGVNITSIHAHLWNNLKNFSRTSFWLGFVWIHGHKIVCLFILSLKILPRYYIFIVLQFWCGCTKNGFINCWFWLWSVKLYQSLPQCKFELILLILYISTSNFKYHVNEVVILE